MRLHYPYEGGSQEQERGLINDDNNNSTSSNNNLVYRYDWLIGDGDIQTIQNKIIDFVNRKKKDGMTSKGISNYINSLQRF